MIQKSITYKQQFTLKVRLNGKAVRRTEYGKTQRMIGLLCVVFKSDALYFLNISPANTVALLCSVDLLYYVC